MSKVGQKEKATQKRVVKLFQNQLGYTYLGDWEKRENNRNVEEDILREYLVKRKYDSDFIDRGINELTKVTDNTTRTLYNVNKEAYRLLRYGVQIAPDIGENKLTVHFIDWKEPLNNDFYIAEEVTVRGESTKRPDIVLYVNGIALGVLELKKSTVSIEDGIRQNIGNQQNRFIKPFFNTIQLVMAGNDSQGLRYGTIETKEKYYLQWKEENADNSDAEPLDQHLMQLCNKERFIEIMYNFIAFDRGIKKVCRPNQYFGIKSAQEHVKQRQGGIIWHTQGSGKSLTIVWLTKWIRENVTDARVLIITDRTELDDQIEKVFFGVNEEIYRTSSGRDLIGVLNAKEKWLMCSLIHKFPYKEEAEIGSYIEELKKSIPSDFSAKGDIYVFVDECHRTQSGVLHDSMKEILPNAMFIGFTGTPLLKADKKKSIEVFGGYIHTYKFNEAVKDNVVLDLSYEARDIDQYLNSPELVEAWFEANTEGLTDMARSQLKEKWGTMQKVLSSQSRLEQIVNDIRLDMLKKDRLKNGRGNAMLVAGSIYEACKFYDTFTRNGFTKCAIITSYRPNRQDIAKESSGEDGYTEKLFQYNIYEQMLKGQDPDKFEKDTKEKFINEPAQMKLLIVVDKLLTGFDAPSATYLYIDKQMRNHGLFQAICRVNRLDGEDKEYGFIVDYKDLFKSLEKSIHDYTSEVFDGYDEEDISGLLENRLVKGYNRLETAREAIKSLIEPVPPPKESRQFRHYFCAEDTTDKDALKDNEPKRVVLYKLTNALIRAYANIANEMEMAGYTIPEINQIKQEVHYFTQIRDEVRMSSGDYIDLKMYEPAMRHLIDSYIQATPSQKISEFDDMTLIQMIVERGEGAIDGLPDNIAGNPEAVAETIENNLRRVIIDENPTNPKYFEKMSDLLDALIVERREKAKDYGRFLRDYLEKDYRSKLIDLAKQVQNPSGSSTYPKSLKTGALRALYDNLDEDEELATSIDEEIRLTKKDSWRGHPLKEKEVLIAIYRHIEDEDKALEIFELVRNQEEY